MDPEDPITKQMEEFNQRLATIAYHQQQVMARQLGEQARRYRDALSKPPAQQKMLGRRAWQWLNGRVASVRKQHTGEGSATPEEEEDVVEAEYTVIDQAFSDQGQESGPSRKKV